MIVSRKVVFSATGRLVQPTWTPDGRWLARRLAVGRPVGLRARGRQTHPRGLERLGAVPFALVPTDRGLGRNRLGHGQTTHGAG